MCFPLSRRRQSADFSPARHRRFFARPFCDSLEGRDVPAVTILAGFDGLANADTVAANAPHGYTPPAAFVAVPQMNGPTLPSVGGQDSWQTVTFALPDVGLRAGVDWLWPPSHDVPEPSDVFAG
jgi:hypothetical protein